MAQIEEANLDGMAHLVSKRAIKGETMILNMGPQHPSTHGVLRLLLELDGETVVSCIPDIGFLHTGIEKNMESKTYQKAEVMTDRLDYMNTLGKFISRKGRPFKAFLVLGDGKLGFEFEPRTPRAKGGAKASTPKAPVVKLDFTGHQPLGACPKCEARVCEAETAYVCEKSQAEKRPCRFKITKVILQQPIDRAQATKLLSQKRTDLLSNFISSKTGRPFKAYLVMEDDSGKFTFDFPPREGEGDKPL